jgi:hypothetical protein
MGVTTVLTVGFVILRWLEAGQHRLSSFVLAGSRYTDRSRAPAGLVVRSGPGYDGQFYYRLALNPFALARSDYGIRFDSLSRVERIGYPFVAWVLSAGDPARVPLALVAANVLAAALLGLAGGLVARSCNRHALWGLVFPLYWGYLWTVGRDLSELTTAAFVVLALAALLRHHWTWAGLAFLGAVVSKETAVLLVGTLAVATLWVRWGGRATTALSLSPAPSGGATRLALRRSDVAYLIPLGGFLLWQAVLWDATGTVPVFESGGQNLGLPLVGLGRGLAHYLAIFPNVAAVIWLVELVVVVMLVVSALAVVSKVPREIGLAWVVSVLLGLCAATGIWLGDVGFRSLDDIYLLSWVVLLMQPRRVTRLAIVCGGMWCVVAVELIRYI